MLQGGLQVRRGGGPHQNCNFEEFVGNSAGIADLSPFGS